ncbi:MAG: RNAseH domain-containing protein [Okeania sp. SIO2H7]|nr:RNAseH domain-containing protein [Okeania sp. SIO2H7]
MKISATSSATGLFKLKPGSKTTSKKTNKTGCVAYLSVSRELPQQNKRGPSCYRQTQEDILFKRKNDKNKLKTVYNKADLPLSTLEEREPWVDMWPTPNPLEIVVTLRQEGDKPDELAALVESLRYQFGHYSKWTALPAPLFFERVVWDYISDFALEEEDDSE